MKTIKFYHQFFKNSKADFFTRCEQRRGQSHSGGFFPGGLSPFSGSLIITIFTLVILHSIQARAQDPALPPTNLGLANVYDGIAGKPGFVYVAYVQPYNTRAIYGTDGEKLPTDLKVNSLLSMNQLIYLTPVKLLGGNLGFTTLIPVVKISATNAAGASPSVNPSLLGDVVVGSAIQWSDKKVFGKQFSHRIELDVNFPTGSYNSSFMINPSSRMYSYGIYHAFTVLLDSRISMSARNQFNYNGKILNGADRPGAFYNGNYSLDFSILKNLKIEAAAYYLVQLNQDEHQGDKNYYLNNYNIANTKENVFALGGGLAYFAKNGVLLEAKMFYEISAQNRASGNRPTLRIAIPF